MLKKSPLKFPIIGYIVGVACIAYFVVIADESLSQMARLPSYAADTEIRLAVIFTFLIAVIFEIVQFKRNRNAFDQQIEKYKNQLDELFKSKNLLQSKVHKYSEHADKLKLFISDRLLEYIEYDEKFLHFKNIASEVRHNGVICYDKVISALQQVLDNEEDECRKEQYQDTLSSMVYLWDLLDLSTTDNIAMYIANKLYESEELYYRQVLENNSLEQPYSPTFLMRNAVIKALGDVADEASEAFFKNGKSANNYTFSNSRYWLHLDDVGLLLGNENYIVLMAENVINNGLYYSENRKYGNKYSRLAVELRKENNSAILSVYNPGPHISEEVSEKIFQLGFSTKRTKGHSGKGLGLYFVKQIISGYEGSINFENVTNGADTYVLRVELSNNTLGNDIIETVLTEEGKLVCQGDNGFMTSSEIDLDAKIKSIEVSVQSLKKTFEFNKFDENGKTVFTDPYHPATPQWCVEIPKSRKKITFKPLDIIGVKFTVSIPTAESRLDANFHDTDNTELSNLEPLNAAFNAKDYTH